MPYKDPETQKSYQREWQRQRRAGRPTRSQVLPGRFKVLRVSAPEEIRTAHTLLNILGGQIRAVLETDEGDVFMRARTAGYLISIGLRAVEVADLESRVAELEDKIMETGGRYVTGKADYRD